MADIVKRPWSVSEVLQLKEMYAEGIDTRDIAAKLGRTRRSVRGKAHCLGVSHKMRDDYLYSTEEDTFIIENAKTMTREAIGKEIGRSEGSISIRGRRLGIEFCDPIKHAIYSKNMHFFSYPNIVNSYIAGWIASDGWIRPISSGKFINQVGISLAIKDIHILEHLKTVTEYTGGIREYEVDGYPQAELRMSGVPQWLKDLNDNWNLTPNKTYTLQPPNIDGLSHQQLLAYQVGLIEGDGHISMSKGTLLVSFVTASKPFAEWIAQLWVQLSGGEPAEYTHKTSNAYYVSLYGKNARNLCRELFKVNVHRLDRKWDIAEHEIERWNTSDKG